MTRRERWLAGVTWTVLVVLAVGLGAEWVERERLARRLEAAEAVQAEVLSQVEALEGGGAEAAVARARALVELASEAVEEARVAVEAAAGAAEDGGPAVPP